MATNTLSIKANNHRIYPCPAEKKMALLHKILLENSEEDTVVVCSKDVEKLQAELKEENVRVFEDKEFVQNKELQCAFLISYDMPVKDIVYIARVSKAKNKAVMLLDESEQKELHAIEMLLGRAIKQEVIEGFAYEVAEKPKTSEAPRKKLSKEEIKEVAKKRYEKSTQDKPAFDESQTFDKPKREFAKGKPKKDDQTWKKKKTAPKKSGKIFKMKAKKSDVPR